MTTPLQAALPNSDRDIANRLARFAQTNNSLNLWPAISEQELLAGRAVIESAVRQVLLGAVPSLGAENDGEVYVLRIAAFTTGTGALLGRWLHDGLVQATPGLRTLFAHELDQGRRRSARIEREVLPAIDALLARGITPVAQKGFHIARAYVEEPGVRPIADVDLIVAPSRRDDAEQALRDAGFEPRGKPFTDPYKRSWRATHVSPRFHSLEGIDERDPWEIDLHTSFDRLTVKARAHLDVGAHHVQPLVVAGRTLLVPAQPLLIQVLASQLSADINSLRLMRVLDLVRVIRTDTAKGRLDWNEASDFMRQSASLRFAYPALALAEKLSPGTVPPRILEDARNASSWGARQTVSRLVPGGASFATAGVVERLMWSRSPLEVLTTSIALVRGDTPFSLRPVLGRIRTLARRLGARGFALSQPDERRPALRDVTARNDGG